ncbi:hypothetical protein HII12_002967 [Brettanomyces bruxellensis]|uniref:Uncharacterized protein n=1 Tax=Dekkera bruxellensis TaxID=5007 RepID=A0A8H6BEF9_DEKBR|nr:hypothetical protein HII12_002967 [Brettanomyces bruxellensis]
MSPDQSTDLQEHTVSPDSEISINSRKAAERSSSSEDIALSSSDFDDHTTDKDNKPSDESQSQKKNEHGVIQALCVGPGITFQDN